MHANAHNSPIFWLNGSAGTGKTTIAYTVAHKCKAKEPSVLGACFFCSRDDAECSNLALIFTTIAYQLGLFNAAFGEEVSKALKADPSIGYAGPLYQLEELIVKPLRVVRRSFPRCVVVLDALDECKDTATTSTILRALSCYVTELSPMKFLLTSRPENPITLGFASDRLQPNTQRFNLHEVKLDLVVQDITYYLSSKLAVTKTQYGVTEPWPSKKDIQTLAQQSSGLFIFAATSIKFIEDRSFSNPRGQLIRLITNADTVIEKSSPLDRLDELYREVLTRAFPDIHFLPLLKTVLGSVAQLRDPLSPSCLEILLGLESGSVRETLSHLHSIVIVPNDESHGIRLLHPSFFDFITNPTRCAIPKFLIPLKEQDTLLTQCCLRSMKDLCRDLCQIGDYSLLNSEVDNISTRILTQIPSYLQYACRHWAYHLAKSMISEGLLNLLHEFVSEHLLHWLEVCSLLGELQGALSSVAKIHQILSTVERKSQSLNETMRLLSDCERFACEFFPIYHSALFFTPTDTMLRQNYSESMDLLVKAFNAVGRTWNPCMRIMLGHSSTVKSVAFSPDGAHIASGSKDTTVRLWNAASGAHLQTLKGHLTSVNSVAFSPDGTFIASGSDDKTVRLWNAASGVPGHILEGHWPKYSTCIASGSRDRTVRLWNTVSGANICTLEGHSKGVRSIAFSSDGKSIASASQDATVRLWDTVSVGGACLYTLKGHSKPLSSLAFSPDGTRIASSDNTVCWWDATSGTVSSVAISPDNTRIVSGADNGSVWLWNASAQAVDLQTFDSEKHSASITSLTFSPDGTCIASTSYDQTIRLWNATSGAHLHTLKGHLEKINSAVFSPNGTYIASGSSDETIRLWNTRNGIHLRTLGGHFGAVSSVAFSSDGGRIASGSHDKTVRLWDADSDGTRIVSASSFAFSIWNAAGGPPLHTVSLGYPNTIVSIVFSPDGSRIVSAGGGKLYLWDSGNGKLLDTVPLAEDRIDLASAASRLAPTQSSFSSGDVASLSSGPTPTRYYILQKNQWIYSLRQKRRICWIPAGLASVFSTFGDRVALANDGRVAILEFAGIDSSY
ncbi:WD40-repeat-containing domain protein [Mycena sp. CBHHK59/15]|nr:WD40-repeat-containing domain protein [Mycena sp. CBHHK59/15]